MKKLLKSIWDNYEKMIQIVLFTAIILIVTIQIFSRVVLRDPLMFTEELARFLYLWMIFLGIPWVFRNGWNLSLDLSPAWMVRRKKAYFNIGAEAVNIAMSVFLIIVSIPYIRFAWINPAPAMRFSMGYVYLVLPISMILASARSLERIIIHIKRLKDGDNFDEYVRLVDIAKEVSKKEDIT